MAPPHEMPPAPEATEFGLGFEVERILDVRLGRKFKEYLVRWVGYGAEEDSWEPQKGFVDHGPMEQFEAKRHSLLPQDQAVWRRFQKVGPEHQTDLPKWRANPRAFLKGAKKLSGADELAEGARQTAALLTAASFGPISTVCFVGPTAAAGLGLFARSGLPTGTPICEYKGPVLPVAWQQQVWDRIVNPACSCCPRLLLPERTW